MSGRNSGTTTPWKSFVFYRFSPFLTLVMPSSGKCLHRSPLRPAAVTIFCTVFRQDCTNEMSANRIWQQFPCTVRWPNDKKKKEKKKKCRRWKLNICFWCCCGQCRRNAYPVDDDGASAGVEVVSHEHSDEERPNPSVRHDVHESHVGVHGTLGAAIWGCEIML